MGDDDASKVKALRKYVDKINALEPSVQNLSDANLREKTQEFKDRLAQGETLDDILPEAFAVVREASRRVLGMRHFDVQLIGGMVLHQGKIAEMRTGEGKTLVATLPSYLNALTGKGVHVVTVNDYLAKRDSEWMGNESQHARPPCPSPTSGVHSNSRPSSPLKLNTINRTNKIYNSNIAFNGFSVFFYFLRITTAFCHIVNSFFNFFQRNFSY